MRNVFINKVQLAFGNEEGIVSLCLNDDTTLTVFSSFIPNSGCKYSHTNSYIFAMTPIMQDDHLTAGAWAAYGDTSTCLIISQSLQKEA